MVSMILVASKVLDGITDMFAGFIVDRSRDEMGKKHVRTKFLSWDSGSAHG